MGTLLVGGVLAQSPISLVDIADGIGGFAIDGEAAGNRAGFSIAGAGDVNGDGLADIVIGAPAVDANGASAGTGQGRVYVVFGKSTNNRVQLSAIANGVGGFAIGGTTNGEALGHSVAGAGDVNGDGLADVVAGAPLGSSSAGRALVGFGRTSAAVPSSGFTIASEFLATNALTGASVAGAGDVNGDGLADVVIGAPGLDPNGATAPTEQGRAYVVFGRTATTTLALSAIAGGASTLGFPITAESGTGSVGSSVEGPGDVDGDGFADVIVGAENYSDPYSQMGKAYLVLGKTSGTTVALSSIATFISTIGFPILNSASVTGDLMGSAVAGVGDLNGDGDMDLVVGAKNADAPAGTNSGRAFVFHGRGAGIGPNTNSALNGISGFVLNGATAGDNLGDAASAAGDMNGDGIPDLILGAPGRDLNGSSSGAAYVVLGKRTGSPLEMSTIEAGTSGLALLGEANFDRAGFAVAGLGDINGDGLSDVAVSAPYAYPNGLESGRVYVIFSPFAAATTATYRGSLLDRNDFRRAIGAASGDFDRTTYPDSRCWLDFDDGDDGKSLATVQIRRDDLALRGTPQTNVADVMWTVSTTRTGWNNVRVTVRYTDEEIAGLNDGLLQMFFAPVANGGYAPAASQTSTPSRNEISGVLTSLPAVIVLGTGTTPTATITRLDDQVTSADVVDYLVAFSQPVAPTFTVDDINLTGSLAATSSVVEIINTDPLYVVRLNALPTNTSGTLGFTIGVKVETALGGFLNSTNAPTYTIQRPALAQGDIDGNGVVNVADVTALANYIVNGTLPPL